ncbi:hypothetical protein KO489_10020 [Reinekea forsetii]|nr:hypothetical protein [Reinekea forsetii]
MEDIGPKNLVEVKGAGRSAVTPKHKGRSLPKVGGKKLLLPTPRPINVNIL